MQIKNLPADFEPARPILATIEQAGFEAYFVGGCVRDMLLGEPIHDIDIATSAYPAEIKGLFKRTVDTGIEHGTVMILDHGQGFETTTFRTESGYQDYRRPDQVTFVRSLAEDLQRRDFTINALAMKEDGQIVDLFDGQADLDRHLIRAVGDANERFQEDALRMMRAVRFAAKLDFEIDPATVAGITANAALLEKIAVERVQVEFEKLLLGKTPARGLKVMLDTNLYRYCPGLADQAAALQELAGYQWPTATAETAWTVLVATLGFDRPTTEGFLRSWKLSNQLIKAVQRANHLLSDLQAGKADPLTLFKGGQAALTTALAAAKVMGIALDEAKLTATYQALPIKDKHELAVNGGDLIKRGVIKPGPAMGQVLNQLLQAVVEGQVANDEGALLAAAQELTKGE